MVRRNQIDWRLVGRLGLTLLAMTVLPVLTGMLLDHGLHTTPIITLAMMFIGFNLGIITIYRHIAVAYAQISPPDPAEQPIRPTGSAPNISPELHGAAAQGDPKHLGGDPC